MKEVKTVELSLSRKYVSDWGAEEAIREILQNAIDQKADGGKVTVSYSGTTLSVCTIGKNLDRSTLLLGESGKDDNRYIGKYGEGYKLAMLVLTRMGHEVTILMRGERWMPKFRNSETFGGETLQVDIFECEPKFEYEFTEFVIRSISPSLMRRLCDKFIALERLMGRDIGAKRESEYGTIMLESKYKGKFYVGGLFVQEDTDFAFGYDFKPEHVSLDRDRRAINHYELIELTARAMTTCGDTSLLVKSLEQKHIDVSDSSTVLCSISQEHSENFKHYYFDRHGLEEGTFVGTKAMCEVASADLVHEDNKIVSRILAKANGCEDEIEEIEKTLRTKDDRESAIKAFNRSDYKKILVWMRKQKRLYKYAREDLRRIIDASKELSFYGKGKLLDEVDALLDQEDERENNA